MDYQQYFINPIKNNAYREMEEADFFMNRLNPEGLCLFAAHAIFPYVFSLKKGSWFRWEKAKNSVVAQCPNPDTCLAFRITKESTGIITAEVIGQKKECFAGHKIGSVFEVSSVKDEPVRFPCCNLNKTYPLSVSVVSHSRLCRYYTKPGHAVPLERLGPQAFCLVAYYTVYPYALSLLYDGVDFEKIGGERIADISCVNNKDYIKMEVKTQKNIFTPALNFLEKILRWLMLPKDVLDKSVKIKIIEISGSCPCSLQLGQIVSFNLYRKDELCPAVFYNLFPFLGMLNIRVFPYWAKNNKQIDIHCPDAGADIVYRVSLNDSGN